MTDPVLRSYKITHDSGFAPNPFWGQLTLATCKPGIRRVAKEGEWIAGFTSGRKPWNDQTSNERLIYVMQVGRVMSYARYYRSKEFSRKIPVPNSRDRRRQAGDNMYIPLVEEPGAHQFRQVGGAWHDDGNQSHDLNGLNVLVAKRFVYFGREPLELPREFRPDVPRAQSGYGRFTRDPDRVRAFLDYVDRKAGLDAGLLAMPADWPEGDLMAPPNCAPRRSHC